jgi:hypothetical protein
MREFFSVHSHRRQILLAGTALVAAYVRTFFQYHQYGWNSVLEFLTSWFIHSLHSCHRVHCGGRRGRAGLCQALFGRSMDL